MPVLSPLVTLGQVGNAHRRLGGDPWAADREDLAAMQRSHDLATTGLDPRLVEQSVELDALVAQRITLVHADHRCG